MSRRTIGLLPQVSAAHLVSHFHIMVIPALLPLLPDRLGVGFVADYALLSMGIPSERMGRAFSIHTFAGYLGGAIAPALLLAVAAMASIEAALLVAALVGGLAMLVLRLPASSREGSLGPAVAGAPVAAGRKAGGKGADASWTLAFSPMIMLLTLLFVLLSLSVGAIDKFSVSALVQGFDVPLYWANTALTAFLFASAFGVLAGGLLADRTRHHGFVAGGAFAAAAVVIAIVATTPLGGTLLVGLLGLAGFLTGVIAPSRDMLVKAAAPAGAEGKTFGIVMTGFNIGGTAGPVLFGWLLDQGQYAGIFWAAVVFMSLTVVLTLGQEWWLQSRRRGGFAAQAGGEA